MNQQPAAGAEILAREIMEISCAFHAFAGFIIGHILGLSEESRKATADRLRFLAHSAGRHMAETLEGAGGEGVPNSHLLALADQIERAGALRLVADDEDGRH
jgi:hypothetical protein